MIGRSRPARGGLDGEDAMPEEAKAGGRVPVSTAPNRWPVDAPELLVRAEIASALETFFEICGASRRRRQTSA
jgi:hypothetical protein